MSKKSKTSRDQIKRKRRRWIKKKHENIKRGNYESYKKKVNLKNKNPKEKEKVFTKQWTEQEKRMEQGI